MGWVAIDNSFYKELQKVKRPFTRIEAMFFVTYDMNFNNKNSIKGYSKMWGWSRQKVRKFLEEINTKEGCVANGAKNQKGHPVRLLGNGSAEHKDTLKKIKSENDFEKGHPIINNGKVFNNHRDTKGLKRTPKNHVKSTFLTTIRTPF